MKLEDFSKEELLEALGILFEEGDADPESLYSDRSEIIDGPVGDECWRLCQKYRQPLIDYCYRNLNKEA